MRPMCIMAQILPCIRWCTLHKSSTIDLLWATNRIQAAVLLALVNERTKTKPLQSLHPTTGLMAGLPRTTSPLSVTFGTNLWVILFIVPMGLNEPRISNIRQQDAPKLSFHLQSSDAAAWNPTDLPVIPCILICHAFTPLHISSLCPCPNNTKHAVRLALIGKGRS